VVYANLHCGAAYYTLFCLNYVLPSVRFSYEDLPLAGQQIPVNTVTRQVSWRTSPRLVSREALFILLWGQEITGKLRGKFGEPCQGENRICGNVWKSLGKAWKFVPVNADISGDPKPGPMTFW